MNHKNTFFSVIRLVQFCKQYKLEICGEKASFGGTCLTQSHIDELWRLHDEVHTACRLTLHVIVVTNVNVAILKAGRAWYLFSYEQNQEWKEGIERPYFHVDIPGSLEQHKE